ncbi:uncharacterized protein [Lepeophtheirus salmonis]|uniref:uncharacterized protein isoform X1 n=1 Tax=Lepeophtheirus salmonis TaxID=72036 RepID=UPI001AEB18A6|nr:uncharacterized protein LOC121119909 isoform X1 [Lepeophtheirus salmonis]
MFFNKLFQLISATSITTQHQTDILNNITTLESQTPPIESNLTKIQNLFDTRFFPLHFLEHAQIHHQGRVLSLIFLPKFKNDSLPKFCSLKIVDESIKNNLLESLGMESDVIREIPFQEMTSIIDTCNTLDKVLNPNETTNIIKKDPETKDDEDVEDVYFKSIFSGIVPGTKWCGINDIAVNYHDIGDEGELDRCCRAHDHCPVKVKAFQSNYGTFNFHPYTKSHCYCDNVFYNCLKRLVTGENSTNTPLQKAHTIGNIYFNVIGIECIEPKFPVHCLESMNEEGIVIIHEATSTYRQPNIPLHRFRRSFNFGQSNDGNSNNNERTDKCIKWTVDMSREPKYFQPSQCIQNFYGTKTKEYNRYKKII